MSKKIKVKYRITFGDRCFETWAVSERQAVNNIKFQLGLAGSYEYHNYEPTNVEIINIIEKKEEN